MNITFMGKKNMLVHALCFLYLFIEHLEEFRLCVDAVFYASPGHSRRAAFVSALLMAKNVCVLCFAGFGLLLQDLQRRVVEEQKLFSLAFCQLPEARACYASIQPDALRFARVGDTSPPPLTRLKGCGGAQNVE